MKIRFFYKRKIIQMAGIFLLVCCFSVTASAKNTWVDQDADCAVRIQYEFADAGFSLYRIGDVTEDYDFVVTEEFADYPVDFETMDPTDGKDLAETLAAYVKRDQKKAVALGTTDQNGTLVFSNLSPGVYLVVGDPVLLGEEVGQSRAFFAFLPLQMDDGTMEYQPEFIPKFSKDGIEETDLTVIKIWKDGENTAARPDKIQIQLLKDGNMYEEVTLEKNNNWTYTWENLSSRFAWQVVEKQVPEGYKVSVSREETTFEVINRSEEQGETPEQLPQTGQLWWPVPVLAAAGLLLFLLGWMGRRKQG